MPRDNQGKQYHVAKSSYYLGSHLMEVYCKLLTQMIKQKKVDNNVKEFFLNNKKYKKELS